MNCSFDLILITTTISSIYIDSKACILVNLIKNEQFMFSPSSTSLIFQLMKNKRIISEYDGRKTVNGIIS